MNLSYLRTLLPILLVASSAAACSSSSAPSTAGTPQPGAGSTTDPGSNGDPGTTGDPQTQTQGDGPFDLDLTITEKLASGQTASTLMFVAVRDAETNELVAFVGDDQNVVSKVSIKKAGLLKAGHRYQVGVKDGWYAGCLDPSANVWFKEIPAVADHVSLALEVKDGTDKDQRGCDVLHEPVDLPPGTYATTQPVLGIAGNRVAVFVSASGRLYTDQLQIFCGTTSSCVSTTLSHGACALEQAVYPGQATFSLGDSSGSHTTVKGTATIDKATQTIHYVGRTYTWTGTSTKCCDQNFDVVLTKQGSSSLTCK